MDLGVLYLGFREKDNSGLSSVVVFFSDGSNDDFDVDFLFKIGMFLCKYFLSLTFD